MSEQKSWFRHLDLSECERKELMRIRDTEPRAYLREKAAALLKIANGWSPNRVALYGLHKPRTPRTIYRWLDYYEAHRCVAVRPATRPAFSPSDEERESILNVIHQSPRSLGEAVSRWTLALLLLVCSTVSGLKSVSGLSRRMRRWRISWKRGRLHVTSPDPHYLEKLAAIDQALVQARLHPDAVRLLYSDEVTCYRKPLVGSCWAEQGHGGQHQQKGWLGHGANTIRRIVGTLDAVSGRVLYRSNSRIGVSQLVAFLKQLRRAYGPHVRLILVWDNWPMHSYDNVLAEAKAQNIELLYLPTYAPWTNPIEKLWRKLKQEVLCMHDLADYWNMLRQRVHDFLAGYDRDAPDLLKYVGLAASFSN